jgi:FtsP/CotA-like multicopper oxidase with cupredoxin domain
VRQGSEIVVAVTNDGDMPATVHWHGLRLENRYDGVPHETQKPIAIGETFTYRVRFPDEGVYWYHPHIREDYGIDMGLYANMIVEPAQPDYWPPSDRDVVLTIDDFLLEHGEVEAYDRAAPDHVAMGRFGNVFLVSGRPGWTMDAREGEVVRFFLTNTANTRVFNLRFDGARMKLVGGDSGRYEHETFVDAVLLAPSERAVVDVAFDRAGSVTLQHVTPDQVSALGSVTVAGAAEPGAIRTFDDLRTIPELSAERERLDAELQREPDKVLALVAEMDMAAPSDGGSAAYACPMDPEVVSDVPDRCPKCGM